MSEQHQPRLPEQRHSIGMPESEIKLAQISWRHKHGMELDPSLLGNALTLKPCAQTASGTAKGSRVRQEKGSVAQQNVSNFGKRGSFWSHHPSIPAL